VIIGYAKLKEENETSDALRQGKIYGMHTYHLLIII
jgi:hypothetical protein